jgi:hypothetical protein
MMANRLWDSFDFQEISALIQDLISQTSEERQLIELEKQPEPVETPAPPVAPVLEVQMNDHRIPQPESEPEYEMAPELEPVAEPVMPPPAEPETKPMAEPVAEPTAEPAVDSERLDPLEHALLRMCKRGGFHGAVLADFGGLPLAIHNSPVEGDLLAAFTTVMGESLVKAATLLNHTNANNISMDINYVDKIVLREFAVGEAQYFLMIICPQTVDERAEVEVSIAHISEIISRT